MRWQLCLVLEFNVRTTMTISMKTIRVLYLKFTISSKATKKLNAIRWQHYKIILGLVHILLLSIQCL